MKGLFEMYGDGIRPTKETRTRWIDHKICAMERAVNKYGLYCQYYWHKKIKRQSYAARKVQQANGCKNSS